MIKSDEEQQKVVEEIEEYVGDEEEKVVELIEEFENNKNANNKKTIGSIYYNLKILVSTYIKKETKGKKNLLLGIILIIISILMKNPIVVTSVVLVTGAIISLQSLDRYKSLKRRIEDKEKKVELTKKRLERFEKIIQYGSPTEEEKNEYEKLKKKVKKEIEQKEKERSKIYDYRKLKL